MKKLSLLLLTLTVCFFTACHKDIWAELESLDQRVTKLEELCKEMNTNITSLQTIVDVLQSNDFITSIVEIKKDGKVVGYTITFGKHDPITIYHGQNGKDGQNGQDGQNGADGKDGSTPVIGVAQDTDGVYYWTLNGEWLLDDNGNKLPVSGKDGKDGANGADGKDGQDGADGSNGQDGITPQLKIENGYWYVSYDNGTTWTQFGKATGADGQDGQNGTDGKDGQDGKDGKDGVTPQLKIEDGYWYISYDNGTTWTQLGKATGEDGKDGADGEDGKDGQNGADGKDGQDGDSMFQSVTQDENYVYFTLADGTVIKIAKAFEEEQPNSEFMFIVTYDANGGEGTMKPDTFYYGVSKQLSEITYTNPTFPFKCWNTKSDGTGISYKIRQELIINKDITLYAQWDNHKYVDLGLSVKWATCNVGADAPEQYGDYYAWGEINPKEMYDWSTYKWCEGAWNTLTKYCNNGDYGKKDYMTSLREADDVALVKWGSTWRMPTEDETYELVVPCTWKWITQNGVNGYKVTSKTNGNSIFLPASGSRWESSHYHAGIQGRYWTKSLNESNPENAACLSFQSGSVSAYSTNTRAAGYPIRPVCP